MTFDLSNTMIQIIVVAVVFLFVGIILGVLIASLLTPENEKNSSKGSQQRRLSPLVQLWRDQQTHLLVLEIEGDKYFTRSEMRKSMIDALEKISLELRIWLGVSRTAELQRLSNEPIRTPTSDLSPNPSKPVEGLPEQPQVQPIRTDITSVLSSAVSSVIRKPQTGRPTTMAAQIDEILQQKLINSTLKRIDIRIMDDPDGGVLVAVGDERYGSVGDVPDPEIKALLRECVAEWEKIY